MTWMLGLSVVGCATSSLRPWGSYSSAGWQPLSKYTVVQVLRGGDADTTTTTTTEATTGIAPTAKEDASISEEPSLDEKVYAAMKKLGMAPPPAAASQEYDSQDEGGKTEENECKDGICPIPSSQSQEQKQISNDPNVLAESIAKDMNVDARLAMAAIGATSTFGDGNQRVFNEQAARDMIQYELDLIAKIPSDAPNVQQLVQEGFDPFLSRRALAFAEDNMEDARAILIADQLDEEEERQQQEKEQADDVEEEQAIRARLRAERDAAQTPDMVEVKTNFDPTALPQMPISKPTTVVPPTTPPAGNVPKPAPKESVVFEATTAQIQELVLESPVPVLLDIYADWCGPCKVLGPALEEMAIKAGGLFRLVKVNSDNERPVSSGALEVTALPTVFGIRDGKIVHMFQGMPRSEDMMKNFMMGLFGAAPFQPPVTAKESKKYQELTAKLIKTAGAASFSFSARERLTDRILAKLDDLVKDETVPDVEGTAELLRTFMNNIVNNPYEPKYRKVNLENKLVAAKIANNANALAILKIIGFNKSKSEMILGKDKKVINVAPLVVARDAIDKWILKNRNEMAAAARKRKDELARAELQLQQEAKGEEQDEEQEEEIEDVDPTACSLKLRIEGKKKVHDVVLNENEPLEAILAALQMHTSSEEEIQITCVAKRLVVKSSDREQMQKSLKQHGLMPSATVVVKVGGFEAPTSSSGLKDRATEKRKKKGSHTMQSVGIYSKDDNNKAELIDGGGGVLYEHDVSDDEQQQEPSEESTETQNEGGEDTQQDTAEGNEEV